MTNTKEKPAAAIKELLSQHPDLPRPLKTPV
jgi:hypothetical protein